MFDDALNQAKKASTKTKVQIVEKVDVVIPKKRKSSGKRTDPDFKQVGAYNRKDTYLQIQKLLI